VKYVKKLVEGGDPREIVNYYDNFGAGRAKKTIDDDFWNEMSEIYDFDGVGG